MLYGLGCPKFQKSCELLEVWKQIYLYVCHMLYLKFIAKGCFTPLYQIKYKINRCKEDNGLIDLT